MSTEAHLDVCDGKADADSFVVPNRASLVRKTIIARSEAIHRPRRHCERSEAIRKAARQDWIASSLTLLAMTTAWRSARRRRKSSRFQGMRHRASHLDVRIHRAGRRSINGSPALPGGMRAANA